MKNKMLRLKAVKEIVGLSQSTIYLMMSKGEFPQNISLGARAVAWSDGDIQAWIDSRISSRGK